jgi:hypothetical protein
MFVTKVSSWYGMVCDPALLGKHSLYGDKRNGLMARIPQDELRCPQTAHVYSSTCSKPPRCTSTQVPNLFLKDQLGSLLFLGK